MTSLESSRVEWMGDTGKQIYGEWADALFDSCNTPSFVAEYRGLISEVVFPSAQRGTILGPDQVFHSNTLMVSIAVEDEERQLTEQILLPHKEEILQYTSASNFIERHNISPEEAIRKHAKDGIKFATHFPAGLANDVFLEKEAASPEEASLAKLQFIAHSLGNSSMVKCVDALSIAGFAFWTDGRSLIEKMTVNRINETDQTWQATTYYGWRRRKEAVGQTAEDAPAAILHYDSGSEHFSIPDSVREVLYASVRKQNSSGLDEEAQKTAGNIAQIDSNSGAEQRKLTRGCPVAHTPSMQKAVEFSANVFNAFVDMYEGQNLRMAS